MEKKVRTITPDDLIAARNLRKLWLTKKKDLGLTQERVAEEFDRTQGLVSQYMTGRIALGPVATLRFARILRVAPKDIRPDIEYNAVSTDLTPEAIEFAYQWLSLPPRQREAVRQHLESLLEARTPDRPDDPHRPPSTH